MSPRAQLPRWLAAVDWGLLRRPLLWLLLAAVLSAALAGMAVLARARLQQQVQAEHAVLDDRIARTQLARESAALLAEHGTTVAVLRERGFLGEEQRLTWVEALKQWQEARRIENLRYQFEPRRPWLEAEPGAAEPPPSAGVLFATRAQIGAQLLHEGDWLALFQQLDAQARGLYTVDQCQLRRLAAGGRKSGAEQPGGLEMACELRWFTLMIEPEPE